MLLIDSNNGNIVNANSSAQSFYGYNFENLCSLNIADINVLSKEECDKQVADIKKGKVSNIKYKHRLKNNSIRDVRVIASPIEINKQKLNFAIIQDITTEERNIVELNKFFKIVDESNTLIGIANLDNEVSYLNKSMRKAFNISENEDVSKFKNSDFYSKDGPYHNLKIEQGSLDSGKWIAENLLQTKEGKNIPVIQSGMIVEATADNPAFKTINCYDITKRKKLEEQIKEQNNILTQMNSDLESFAYIVSHDLKAPLNVVTGFLGLLDKKDVSNEKRDKYLKYIQISIDKMKLLINDLLQFSQIGANKEEFVDLDTNLLLEGIQKDLTETILKNNAKLIISPLPIIHANQTLINELFMNLIGNALKYHKSNKPMIIEIGFLDKEDHFEFHVKDNGIGIAPENLEQVFIMFKRLNAQSEFEGTGIGLALCKKIADAHQGKIWVESVFGEGSTFYFTIKK